MNLAQRAAAAAQAYRDGAYEEAVQDYQALVDAGAGSADVWFNLGNAHYHTGARGKAAWAWENALRLAPRDEVVRRQLENLRAEAGVVRPAGDSVLHGVAARLDPAGFALVLLAGWIVGCGLVILRPHLRAPWRKTVAGLFAGLAFAGAVVGGTGLALVEWDRRAGWAVAIESVDLRQAPHEGAGVVGRLEEAARVRILRREGSWVLLDLGAGRTGWSRAGAIAPIGG